MIFKKGIATILSTAKLLTAVSPCAFAEENIVKGKNTKFMSTTGKIILTSAGAIGIATIGGIIYYSVKNSPVDVQKLDKNSDLYKEYAELKDAIDDADYTKVEKIFTKNPSLNANARIPGGYTLLTWACYEFARKNLIKTKKSDQFYNGGDVLNPGCLSLFKICELLIKHGARVDVRDSSERDGTMFAEKTPLHYAAGSGSTSLCKLLLDHGADVNARTSEMRGFLEKGLIRGVGDTPLNIAAHAPRCNNYAWELHKENLREDLDDRLCAVCKLLIERGAKARYCNGKFKDHSIEYSAEIGCKETCKLLINKMNSICKTNVDIKPKLNDALFKAVYRGHYETYKLLIDQGADVNAKDKLYGGTLLHQVARSIGFSSRIYKSLIEKKFDVNAKDKNGATPLHIAVEYGKLKICRLLLGNKADINEVNIQDDDIKIADINAKDKKGRTPLDYVNHRFFENRRDIENLLIENGAKHGN